MDLVLLAKAAVMGVVEGLTEFLPISSTGHLARAVGEHAVSIQGAIEVFVQFKHWFFFGIVIDLWCAAGLQQSHCADEQECAAAFK